MPILPPRVWITFSPNTHATMPPKGNFFITCVIEDHFIYYLNVFVNVRIFTFYYSLKKPIPVLPVQQLSSCGGSAEESSDNTTNNAISDGNIIASPQGTKRGIEGQISVIMRNTTSDDGKNVPSGDGNRTFRRQNTRTIRLNRQRRLSLAAKGSGIFCK